MNIYAYLIKTKCDKCRQLECEGDCERSYKHNFETAEAVEKAMAALMDSTNGGNTRAIQAGIIRALYKEHRTLQQRMADLVLRTIVDYFAWAADNREFDARNQETVLMSKRLKKIMDDSPLPRW